LAQRIKVEYVQNLYPVFTKPKRIKIIVGGRGSTKSTGVADYVAAKVSTGELWCCARENQNSIEESVHRTILDEISRLEIGGFEDTKTSITHTPTGGRTFYRGLARNITSLKSTLSGIDGLWIEEGEDISDNTLRVLTASVRLNAKDSARLISGEDVKMPEIIITMNRGARSGAVAQKWLSRAEKELKRCGYYEDDAIMVVQMNHTDMPKEWFEASGLEEERQDDEVQLSTAAYNHKWNGEYLSEVDDSIISVDWFEACIDAHKKLGFKGEGAVIAAHDPSDTGNDSKGYAARKGSIVFSVCEKVDGDINDGCDWATQKAVDDKADIYRWDCDGMGTGLKRQVDDSFRGMKIEHETFYGSMSGKGMVDANVVYQRVDRPKRKAKTVAETFRNERAYNYWLLRDRMFNTYRAVVKGEYVEPDAMISFCSVGIEHMDLLKDEICRIPRKRNGNGFIQIMSKDDMKKLGIESPNMADSVMMLMNSPAITKKVTEINFDQIW
tara:strand:+ start:2252 stop:3745 length:1494 start_codon:yes stop_codon:yes gene_type:complete